jgi:hypothetical protein
MTTRKFNISIQGRVAKIRTKDFLVPLYEAISNAIHSIEASRRAGSIEVQLLREPRQFEIAATTRDSEIPVTGFVITDDGVGFDEANMESFCEADSTFKAKIGGKGVGRFSWLKFFERAVVESVFAADDGTTHRRRFTFSTAGIDDEKTVQVKAPFRTTVTLSPLHVSYEPKTRRALEDVSIAVIEHFIAYFVTDAMPALRIRDGAASQDLKELYQSSIGRHSSRRSLEIKGQRFEATGVRFFLGNQGHTGFLCGNKRAADKLPLGKRDPVFAKRFVDEDLRQYAFHVFIESPYLDELVHDDRDGFRFPEPGSLEALLPDAVTKEEIAEQVLKLARESMGAEIDEVKASNIETVTSFIASKAPQYRNLVAKHRDAIAAIHDSDLVKIDQALRRIQFEDELKTRAELNILLREAEEVDDSDKEDWKRRTSEVLGKLSEEGKATLANYIVHRKLILELLQKRMELVDDSHAREEAVHRLIFPMRTTSDEVEYENQNLWMIDERLSYHYYLASDKPLAAIPPAESDSKKEPDIIVFNRPIALNDRPEGERLESIVIVEFKRPGHGAVEGQKNPVQQIQEYIELIQAGRAKSRKGRLIEVTEATYFFGYVICELDPLLKKVLKRFTMKETPDGRGMFGFFEGHRAYIEVISYEKMMDDARKRNRILFEKLQLPIL